VEVARLVVVINNSGARQEIGKVYMYILIQRVKSMSVSISMKHLEIHLYMETKLRRFKVL
jgi:hypothetical protein